MEWSSSSNFLLIIHNQTNGTIVKFDAKSRQSSPETFQYEFPAEISYISALTTNNNDKSVESKLFLACTKQGQLFRITCDQNDSHRSILNLTTEASFYEYNSENRLLLVLCQNSFLIVIKLSYPDFWEASQLSKVKLSSLSSEPQFIWLNIDILVFKDKSAIQLWNVITNERDVFKTESTLGRLCFNAKQKSLAAFCENNIYIWNHAARPNIQKWNLVASLACESLQISSCCWLCNRSNILALKDNLLMEVNIRTANRHLSNGGNAVIQTNANSLTVLKAATNQNLLDSPEIIQIKQEKVILKAFTTDTFYACWNGEEVTVTSTEKHSFACKGQLIGVCNQSLFTLEASGDIEVRNMQGAIKQIVKLEAATGEVSKVFINGNWMVLATKAGFISIYDLSRREVRQTKAQKSIVELRCVGMKANTFEQQALQESHEYQWQDIGINTTGDCVSFTLYSKKRIQVEELEEQSKLDEEEWAQDAELFVWNVPKGVVHFIDFKSGFSDTAKDHFWANHTFVMSGTNVVEFCEKNPIGWNSQLISNAISCAIATHDRLPIRHFWDLSDPRCLVVQLRAVEQSHPKEQQVSIQVPSFH
ncbi:hypothetical protein Ciccas_007203 [Cichlidogyrus casuarinus]|uniref:IFT140 second beta-propeller domain-containing protein n=1 Tax=Cichlidogyrus casuarinus TaxID=1844966 RepID=A0ABD2Q7H9_9PLAT